MKILINSLLLVTSYLVIGSASAATYQELLNCSSVLMAGGITKSMSMNSAPPYAREKYKKQVEFFQQGSINLAKEAKKFPQFEIEAFANSGKEGVRAIVKNISEGKTTSEEFNAASIMCISMAGLNLGDLQQ